MPALRQSVYVMALFVVGLSVRLVYGLLQLGRGFLFVSEGDYNLYEIGAAHITEFGNFTNSLFLVRPPLFPLLVALTGNNHTALIIINSVLGAALVPLIIWLAFQLKLPAAVGYLAGGLIAIDPITVKYTAFLGPESLSFTAALLMMNLLVGLGHASNAWRALPWGVGAGLALLVSAYTRPSIYLIWTGMSVWLLVWRWRYIAAIAVYAAVSIVGIQLWEAHNQRVFGNDAFSTVGPYTMTYYRANSVLRFGEGLSPSEANVEVNVRVKQRLGEDTTNTQDGDQHGYLAASPEVAAALTATSLEIFRTYPLISVFTAGVGFLRYFMLVPYFPPYSNFANPVNWIVPLWNILLLGLAGVGIVMSLRRREWLVTAVLVLFGGYFTVGTLLVKSAGMSGRERTVMFPMIALAAAYAWFHWRRTSMSDAPLSS